MTKHDPTVGKNAETTTDFETRVEAAFFEFIGKNGGKMPTNSQLNEIVGTSMSRLCPLTRRLKEKHMARETKLSAMSDVPDEIRVAHERLLTDLWIMTRDLQNAELVEMKKALQLQRRDHRAEIDDFETIILDLETLLDVTQGHNAAATQKISELEAQAADLKAQLAEANVRQSERQSLLDELKAALGTPARTKPASARKSAAKPAEDDEPETLELPFK
ncbi:DNA-binding protein [Maritimibacter sp. DP1N21-5]|uniref:DNA-binding protein n=1 Tax=Maritimibacter sp. DP1N21-5 TaxID=2836867 RepID=UPI001C46BE02|nr:DNA-binding protein [Maritimibacter sp. DP1N21-5]MBV7410868.1 DNA-binding protein [Maritimibacter sp. DP1N21-5]